MPSSAKVHINRVWDTLVRSKLHLGPTGVGQRNVSDLLWHFKGPQRHCREAPILCIWNSILCRTCQDCHLWLGGGIFVILRPVCVNMLASLQVLNSGLSRMPSRAASISQHTAVVRTSWEWLVRKSMICNVFLCHFWACVVFTSFLHGDPYQLISS